MSRSSLGLYLLLHQAVASENHKMLALFLRFLGTDHVDVLSGLGIPPLFYAVRRGNEKCAKLLLDHGADPSYRTVDGTPFESAKTEDMIRLLQGTIPCTASYGVL